MSWVAGFGLVTRMLLFVIIGWFLVRTAADGDPRKTVGQQSDCDDAEQRGRTARPARDSGGHG